MCDSIEVLIFLSMTPFLLCFEQKERYLALGLDHSESWWKTHGIFCYRVCSGNETGGTSSGQVPPRDDPMQRCFIPYTVRLTINVFPNVFILYTNCRSLKLFMLSLTLF